MNAKFKKGLLAFVLLPSAAIAQNLVLNADFDNSLAGWNVTSGINWTSAQDHHGPGSMGVGSAFVETAGAEVQTLSQCIPILPDNGPAAPDIRYKFEVWVLGSIGQVCKESAQRFELGPYMRVSWSPNSDCSDSHGGSLTNRGVATGAWQLLAGTATQDEEGATHALIELTSHCGAPSIFYFDDPYFMEASIFANGFQPNP